MKKNILTGALAAREYIYFFRDPIGCMRALHQQRGKLVALGPIAFGEPTKLHVLAIGPEFNRFARRVSSFTGRKTPRNVVFALV